MYELELTTLAKAKVRFVVVGGIAVCLHGHGRTTFDLDIVPDMAAPNARRLLMAMKKLGYRPRLPVSAESLLDKKQVSIWVKERHLQVNGY